MYCKKCNYQLKNEETTCPMCGEQVDLNEDANKKSELVQAIEQLRNGNEKGFSVLYNHTYKYVYSRAKMLSDNEQEIMDILQEVYISVYRNIGTLKSNDSLYAWLRTITFHAGGTMLKKNRKEILLSEEHEEMFDALVDEDNAIEDECLNKQDIEAIRDCIKRLSNEHRAVIMAYYYDNLKVEEISELLSISAGTVKSRLHLARKKLKEYIQEQEKKQGYTFRSFGGVTLALALGSLLQQNMEVSASHNTAVFNNICNELGFASSSKFAGINSVVREGTQMLKGKILKTIAGMGTKKLVAFTIGVVGAVTITGTAVVVGTTSDDNKVNQTETITETKEGEEEKITDTTAPVVKLKDKVFTISDFTELTEEFLVDTVTDDSKYEMSFVGYEKVAGLDVVNDEYIANLKESVGEELSVEKLSADIPTEEGVYRSVISFKDSYETETLVEVYIVYDAPDSGVEETNSTVNNKTNASSDKTTSGSSTNNNLIGSYTLNGFTWTWKNDYGVLPGPTFDSEGKQITDSHGEILYPGQKEAVNAGYYNVVSYTQNDGSIGYAVMVRGGEYDKGNQILSDYLIKLGYDCSVSGSYIDNLVEPTQYGCYADLRPLECTVEYNIHGQWNSSSYIWSALAEETYGYTAEEVWLACVSAGQDEYDFVEEEEGHNSYWCGCGATVYERTFSFEEIKKILGI